VIKEPKRLIESDGALAESLAASRLRLPSEARLSALATRLAGSGIALGEPARLATPQELNRVPSLPGRPLELSLKAILAALAFAVVALLGAGLWRYSEPRAPVTLASSTPPRANLASTALSASSPLPAAAPAPAPVLNRDRSRAEPARAPGVERTPAAASTDAPIEARAAPAEGRAPAGAALSTAPRPLARNAEPASKRAVLDPPTRSERAASSAERLPLPVSTVVDSEVEMLKKARSALSADPLQAFALSERCRAQYPGGAFAQEREFIAISALIRLGRRDEAARRASLFRTRYRRSAYLPQLSRMLGDE
jgi:hypothetical protein